MMPTIDRTCLSAMALSALLLTGCGVVPQPTGPLRHEPVTIDLAGAERANIELNMGSGKLNVRGGADKLLDGIFDYNVDSFKPVVQFSKNGDHAMVTIKQPGHRGFGGHIENTWNLQLNNKTLLDMTL